MKTTKKLVSLLLVLSLVLTLAVSASAVWPVYGGNDNHNAVVSGAPTEPAQASLTQYVDLRHNGSGWDGVDNVPVMQTVNGVTYAYVLYDGYGLNGRVAKINCSAATPYVVWDKQVSGASGFQLSTPYLDTTANELYVGASFAYHYDDVALSSPVALSSGVAGTVTFNNIELVTAGNRVAVPVFVGHTSVANRGTITTSGTASITLGGDTVNLTLSTTASGSNTYKLYEQPTYNEAGAVNGYDYYYYINHNLSDSAGSGKTLTISVTLNGTGSIQAVDMFANQGSVVKLSNLSATKAEDVKTFNVADSINGQINTPIVKYGDNIYFGTWSGNSAYPYYQVNVKTGVVKTFTPASNGFYWAGAVSDGTNIYFGSDNGKLYYAPISDIGSAAYVDLTEEVDNPGNVRSTIMLNDGKLYFTSQGGYLWCCSIGEDGTPEVDWSVSLGGTSTSTPTKVGNRIYVGYYSGFNAGGVKCVSADGSSVQTVASGFPVQCSIVVEGTGSGTDHVFFNTNSSTGCGYCYSYDGNVGSQVWKTANDTYALGGMAYDNGYLVFGNDYDHLYIVGK